MKGLRTTSLAIHPAPCSLGSASCLAVGAGLSQQLPEKAAFPSLGSKGTLDKISCPALLANQQWVSYYSQLSPGRRLSSFCTVSAFLTYSGEVVSALGFCLYHTFHRVVASAETPAHADTSDSPVLWRDSCRDMQISVFPSYASAAPRDTVQEGNVQTL